MKHIVSVSLGTSRRDHKAEAEFAGEKFLIERRGVNGDLRKAKSLLRELDGKVDVIGLGGLDVYIYSKHGRFALREGLELLETLKETPAVDGSGLKNTLEAEVVSFIAKDPRFSLKGKKVMMVCAMDRFGMAEAFVNEGAETMFGDLIFSMGKDSPIYSLEELAVWADRLLPDISKLPLAFIYPMGKRQDEPSKNKFPQYYEWADYIVGDFHYIRKYLPPRIPGKIIVTNTVTPANVEDLKSRGAEYLIATTPDLAGRSFGTNVLEAVFVALLGKPWTDIKPEDYLSLIKRLNLKPRIEKLN